MAQAVNAYQNEVKTGQFPDKEHSFIIDSDVLEQLKVKLS
jgi:ketopantoate hydroxymethyltransferase